MNKLFVIAVMETDGRFVQYVTNAYELRTDLRCQAYTLSFAAGEGSTRPVECEII